MIKYTIDVPPGTTYFCCAEMGAYTSRGYDPCRVAGQWISRIEDLIPCRWLEASEKDKVIGLCDGDGLLTHVFNVPISWVPEECARKHGLKLKALWRRINKVRIAFGRDVLRDASGNAV